jgi:xanthine dehydrogenase accessory factor
VQAIVAPAGQPIGAQTPPEIALSVLAAVVAARRAGDVPATDGAAQPAAAAASEPAASVLPAAAAAAGPGALPAARAAIAPLPDLPPTGKSCCGG